MRPGEWLFAGVMLVVGIVAVGQTRPAASTSPAHPAPGSSNATKPAATKPAMTDADMEKALQDNVAALVADKLPLEKVLASLRQSQGISIMVNWVTLKAKGVTPNTPVTINLKNVPLQKTLVVLLAQTGPANALDYAVSDGTLVISTRDDLAGKTSVKNYDVRPILAKRGNTPAAANQLIALIKRTAQPNSWVDTGGKGMIRLLNGTLIITQNYHGHKAVEAVLATFK
jgi:hypothetical protein